MDARMAGRGVGAKRQWHFITHFIITHFIVTHFIVTWRSRSPLTHQRGSAPSASGSCVISPRISLLAKPSVIGRVTPGTMAVNRSGPDSMDRLPAARVGGMAAPLPGCARPF
jgi:hypothetical protein